ncbi:3'(2'),5'-bisphosphate nucleotidase CysQ [Ectothiorhodospiraceae bacterium 2226]|nr:3'(2'),5'-bisphosphate nucleotidase CysQ [Ectothiorhodospiraceae bacterium 2226]
MDLNGLLPEVVALAREAGERILEVYETDFEVQIKGDDSPLTHADLAAHRTIVGGLRALTPELPVLSEESAAIPFEERARWRRYWLVDPLDGTREFVKRNGEFTVNIALIDNHEPVLGVVGVPVKNVAYYARRGGGAWRADSAGATQAIHARPLPDGPPTVAGSRSHAGRSLSAFLARLGTHELVSMGSALKSCLVAEGKADVYPRLGPTSEWDTAAAQAVVEEAGGHVTDTAMRPLRYNTKESLLNPHFFAYGANQVDWSKYLEAEPAGARPRPIAHGS